MSPKATCSVSNLQKRICSRDDWWGAATKRIAQKPSPPKIHINAMLHSDWLNDVEQVSLIFLNTINHNLTGTKTKELLFWGRRKKTKNSEEFPPGPFWRPSVGELTVISHLCGINPSWPGWPRQGHDSLGGFASHDNCQREKKFGFLMRNFVQDPPSDAGEGMPSRQGGTVNSRRTTSPLVWLVEGEERWKAPYHSQGVLPQNRGGNELNHSVLCMVPKATANDMLHLALCHEEFRGPQSRLCRSELHNVLLSSVLALCVLLLHHEDEEETANPCSMHLVVQNTKSQPYDHRQWRNEDIKDPPAKLRDSPLNATAYHGDERILMFF
ncbi:uncharacterized protein TNCV_3148961 [Trichonephila clavipes]|nr:uncharacterized protein TNCV_3148961 [Trichonephila clavipes]